MYLSVRDIKRHSFHKCAAPATAEKQKKEICEMKRTLALFLALLMALSLCACGGDNASPSGTAPAPLPSGDTQSDDATEEQTEPPAVTLTLGEAASTDVAEFTLQ